MDIDAFAELVVSTIKSALGPVQADVRTLQGQIAVMDARWNDLGALRERVAVVETKALAPPDLSPLVSRVDAADMRLSDVDKYAARVEGYTSFLQRDLAALTERVAVAEAKAAQPPDLHEVSERLSTLQLRQEMSTAAEQALVVEVHKLHDVRERVAVLEMRAPVPGPAGKDGVDGLNGKDGADGLGFDDLEYVYDEHGRLSIKCVKGERVKEARVPGYVDRGVYREGTIYQKGDGVSFGGGFFIAAHDDVSEKPETGSGWRLAVKRGRDGRDGKDAPAPVPVVKVGAR